MLSKRIPLNLLLSIINNNLCPGKMGWSWSSYLLAYNFLDKGNVCLHHKVGHVDTLMSLEKDEWRKICYASKHI